MPSKKHIKQYEHVMLDIETFGTAASSVIVSIGAVAFNPFTDERSDHTFHRFIDIDAQLRLGRSIDASTLIWWLGQDDEARKSLIDGYDERCTPAGVLEAFTFWLAEVADPRTVCVWGNGAAFDNALLASLYRTCEKQQPWMFWNDRCFRTLKALNKHVPAPAHDGVDHDALSDAVKQSKHLQAMFNAAWKKVTA